VTAMHVQFRVDPVSPSSAASADSDTEVPTKSAPLARTSPASMPSKVGKSSREPPQRSRSQHAIDFPGSATAMTEAAVHAMSGAAHLAAKAVSVVADEPQRAGPTKGGKSSSPRSQDNRKQRYGIFFRNPGVTSEDPMSSRTVRRGDFRQLLDSLLSSEETTQQTARELYKRLDGDLRGLPQLQQRIKEKWGFPERVFPLLETQLRRARGGSGSQQHRIEEQDWVQAFVRWLEVLRMRAGRTKVSRKQLIRKHNRRGMAKLYSLGNRLGAGTFGEVHLAKHTTLQTPRVIKSIEKSALDLAAEQVASEIDTLASLDHPHIIRIFEAFEAESRYHIVMDYAEGGDLSDAIRQAEDHNTTLPERWSRLVAQQTASALEYMHSQGVIHCDLKPQNTMLLRPFVLAEAKTARPHTLVVDFGISELVEGRQNIGNLKGSPSYLAPEGFEGKLSTHSDMWALGAMIYELSLGKRPFQPAPTLFVLYTQVSNNHPPMEGLSEGAREVVSALMRKDPKERPSARDCFKFAWFSEAGLDPATPPSTRERFEGLQSCSSFYRTTMMYVAAGLGMSDLCDLGATFQDMDTSKTGTLSVQELEAGLAKMGIQREPATIRRIFDMDQDGKVDYSEFVAGALRLEQLETPMAEKLLRYAFEVIDADDDGHIDMDELRNMFSGDGPPVDVLPDGTTVEDVMEEMSRGKDRASFADFERFMRMSPPRRPSLRPAKSYTTQGSSNTLATGAGTTGFHWIEDEGIGDVVAELYTDVQNSASTMHVGAGDVDSKVDAFPEFHEWLNGLYEDQAGETSFFLTFADAGHEAKYVTHYLPHTCQQISLLALALVTYSIWSLLSESFSWDPGIGKWHNPPRVSNNLAWIALMISGLSVIASCLLRLRRQGYVATVRAQTFERWLCGWACVVPFVSCFFANRHRTSALFGYEALDVFETINSDYDLIVVMLGALMFLSTRTNLRFAATCLIASSSIVAYLLSSAMFGTPYTDCGTERNWVWPAVLLVLVSMLGLSGHRSVERRKRAMFLSLEASYHVLKESHDQPGKILEETTADVDMETVSRTARLTHALELVRRLSDSTDIANRPLKPALAKLIAVIDRTKEDITHADRLMTVDMRDQLAKLGIVGDAKDLILDMLETPPRVEVILCTESARTGRKNDESWNVLLSAPSSGRPLMGASADLLREAAMDAASKRDEQHGDGARRAADRFLDGLCAAYDESGSRVAEARSALAVRATHWLAKNLGLWTALRPWERFALLATAAGLHCKASGSGGGALLTAESFLGPALSADRTIEVLGRSGLCEGACGCVGLQGAVRRMALRSRPRCAIEDVRRLRVELEQTDEVSERDALCGLVIAAADLAFLALPSFLHKEWASWCKQEGVDARNGKSGQPECSVGDPTKDLDVAAWLRGNIEALALPVYQTLQRLDGPRAALTEPVQNLRKNRDHWLVTPLVVPPRQCLEGSLRSSSGGGLRNTASVRDDVTSAPWAFAGGTLEASAAMTATNCASTLRSAPGDAVAMSMGAATLQGGTLLGGQTLCMEQHTMEPGANDLLQAEFLAASASHEPSAQQDAFGGTVAFADDLGGTVDVGLLSAALSSPGDQMDNLGSTVAPNATLLGDTLHTLSHATYSQAAHPKATGHSSPSDAAEEPPTTSGAGLDQWGARPEACGQAELPGQVNCADEGCQREGLGR